MRFVKISITLALLMQLGFSVSVMAAPPDTDGDGFTNPNDCKPNDPTIYPGAPETCNNKDDDCDRSIDEDLTPTYTYYLDTDNDTFGDPASVVTSCFSSAPEGSVADNTDCNDADAAIGGATTYYADSDTDGFGDGSVTVLDCGTPVGYVTDNTDCDDADSGIFPGAVETCDTIDNDCDASIDEGFDADIDGIADCSDTEECDGLDNDGDGDIDEGVKNTYYADVDGDAYGDAGTTAEDCTAPVGFVATSDDCDDADAGINPASAEVCDDLIDQNCDGLDEACPVIDNDDDDDGIDDTADNCAVLANADQTDTDADGQGDVCDSDDDGDGVNDGSDAFPLDASESIDTDNDGIGDNADDDLNNNGIPDADESIEDGDESISEEPVGSDDDTGTTGSTGSTGEEAPTPSSGGGSQNAGGSSGCSLTASGSSGNSGNATALLAGMSLLLIALFKIAKTKKNEA